jgi:hypothetical protein
MNPREVPPEELDVEQPSTEPQGVQGDPSKRGGMPGDGAGRRDVIGGTTGVHPFSETDTAEAADMPIRTGAEWGQGDRGAAGYEDAGSSEMSPPPEDEEETMVPPKEGTTES